METFLRIKTTRRIPGGKDAVHKMMVVKAQTTWGQFKSEAAVKLGCASSVPIDFFWDDCLIEEPETAYIGCFAKDGDTIVLVQNQQPGYSSPELSVQACNTSSDIIIPSGVEQDAPVIRLSHRLSNNVSSCQAVPSAAHALTDLGGQEEGRPNGNVLQEMRPSVEDTGSLCKNCSCKDCLNTPDQAALHRTEQARVRARNPQAFSMKVEQGSDGEASHKFGCRCRKSRCVKKYCECFDGGVVCVAQCRCLDCENTPEDRLGRLGCTEDGGGGGLEFLASAAQLASGCFDDGGLTPRMLAAVAPYSGTGAGFVMPLAALWSGKGGPAIPTPKGGNPHKRFSDSQLIGMSSGDRASIEALPWHPSTSLGPQGLNKRQQVSRTSQGQPPRIGLTLSGDQQLDEAGASGNRKVWKSSLKRTASLEGDGKALILPCPASSARLPPRSSMTRIKQTDMNTMTGITSFGPSGVFMRSLPSTQPSYDIQMSDSGPPPPLAPPPLEFPTIKGGPILQHLYKLHQQTLQQDADLLFQHQAGRLFSQQQQAAAAALSEVQGPQSCPGSAQLPASFMQQVAINAAGVAPSKPRSPFVLPCEEFSLMATSSVLPSPPPLLQTPTVDELAHAAGMKPWDVLPLMRGSSDHGSSIRT